MIGGVAGALRTIGELHNNATQSVHRLQFLPMSTAFLFVWYLSAANFVLFWSAKSLICV